MACGRIRSTPRGWKRWRGPSSAASLWGARSGVVSIAGTDYPAAALAALESRGVDLTGIRRLERTGLRTWLLYENAGRRVVHQLGRPPHEDASPRPRDIPASFE